MLGTAIRRLALFLLVLPLIANAATLTLNGIALTCSELRVENSGDVVATCRQPQEPKPPSQPAPPSVCVNPAGQSIAEPSNIKMQTINMGGFNNYAVDDINFVNPPAGTDASSILGRVTAKAPSGSIQVFTVPKSWPDGTPALSAVALFAEWLLNAVAVQYEMALSTCKGDFSFYKTAVATNTDFGTPFQPCGVVSGPSATLSWTPQGSFSACRMNVAPASATWYLNWRIVPGTGGNCANNPIRHTCGQVFFTTPF